MIDVIYDVEGAHKGGYGFMLLVWNESQAVSAEITKHLVIFLVKHVMSI